MNLQVGIALDAGHVLHRHRLHHIDLAGQQCGHAGAVVANGREDHLIHIAVDLAPVVAIAREGGATLAGARAGGTGPVPLARNEAAFSMPLRRSTGLVAWLVSHHFLLMIIQLVNRSGRIGKGRTVTMSIAWSLILLIFLILTDVALHVRAVSLGALIAEDHVVGGEGRAVMELARPCAG
jgi:hypothetical protein